MAAANTTGAASGAATTVAVSPAVAAAEEKKAAALRDAIAKLRATMTVPPNFNDKDLTRFLIAR